MHINIHSFLIHVSNPFRSADNQIGFQIYHTACKFALPSLFQELVLRRSIPLGCNPKNAEQGIAANLG